jgi:hypothetical protein
VTRVRTACRFLSAQAQAGDLFGNLWLFTDGRRVFTRTSDPRVVVDVTQGGQLVMAIALDDVARRCRRAGFITPARARERRQEVTMATFRTARSGTS